jgi:cellulose synthase/poly-beta-1,6-N-acetylglucosamine synthase-like glycosyltransferase
MLEILFWILISAIFYTYIGYVLLLLVFVGLKKCFSSEKKSNEVDTLLPEVTIMIAAYNERDIIRWKMQNTYDLDYPSDKLKILWITDGSNDGTPELLREYKDVTILHQEGRNGKTAALNRAMSYIKTPFTVYCDANTMLHKKSVRILISRFNSDKIGCVAGEKRISQEFSDKASGAGEGAYWKYESIIKRLESDLFSTIGAAGELYAIRTELFEHVDDDFIIDDFANSIQIALKGYCIKYSPEAYATESPSFDIREELKRKIRIASGGFQLIGRKPELLNIFKNGFLSFEFISHKLFRWALVPFAIPLAFILNLFICILSNWQHPFYNVVLGLQILFYCMVLSGGLIKKRAGILYLPYYLIIVNYAQIAGLNRFIRRKHSVVWEKAKRS